MSEKPVDERGRLTLAKDLRDRYGDRYRIVGLRHGIKLIPLADDPLDALRDEFADVAKSADELRGEARSAALDE
ncbi:AbrB/MazE/SpoVT family DNA-binding domain-containing protein [Halorubrum yunnanense]|uniref:AbrB/MazE/SpoVT family DNA-binding domain-containing protein n=1 Tax=Halorubrum yunnanense TaxID=1526162 RepID=A0ABD5YH85_9EURY|nr:AbrB/MazE/SpoVT family DNA-binding domain-containing protein [Halorubrum yunnanense]